MLVKQKGNVYRRCSRLYEWWFDNKLEVLLYGCITLGVCAIYLLTLIIGA